MHINLFDFVGNNPVGFADLLGLQEQVVVDRESCFDNCWNLAYRRLNNAAGKAAAGQIISGFVGAGFTVGGLFLASRGALVPGVITSGVGLAFGAVGVRLTMENLQTEKRKIRFKYLQCLLDCQEKYPRCEPKARDFLQDHDLK